MGNMRVYEIAKELGVESKVVIEALNDLGVPVKSHANSVSEEDADRARNKLSGATGAKPAEPAKKAPAAKKETGAKKDTVAKTGTAAKKESAPAQTQAKPTGTGSAAAGVSAGKKPGKKAPASAGGESAGGSDAPDAARRAAPERRVTRSVPISQPSGSRRRQEPRTPRGSKRRGGRSGGGRKSRPSTAPPKPLGELAIEDGITVKAFAEKARLRPADVIRDLMSKGVMANINQTLDADVAVEIARSHGLEARVLRPEEELLGEVETGREEDRVLRAPVVTIMGHVDHGKTQLLDSIRETNVVAREAGGITQHIGASEVTWKGNRIVFIDTPGHAAFTRMRARGAQVTDLVVLVVAADDGIMPQTVEAIDHARAAGVPIIVAVNKIDKPEANVDRVKQQMLEHNLQPEDWGGDIITVPVSAKTRENLEDLLEMIVLQAELLELRANPELPARGIVLEAELDRRRGAVATLLVQSGTLRVGESLIAGIESAKVRAMTNALGQQVKEAGPSTAIEVLGFSDVPAAGDNFQVVEEASVARKVSDLRQDKDRQASLSAGTRLTLEDLHERLRAGDRVKLAVILKADAQGSVETLRDALTKLSGEQVEVEIIHSGVGGVTENDVLLASASDAIIVGFNVRPERGVADAAEREGIDLRLYTIIYQLIDEVKLAMVGQLEPTFEESALGTAEVRDTFRIPKAGLIAGCYVTEGKFLRGAKCRLLRDSRVIYEGKVGSLRRFKDDVREVQSGYECGIGLENYNDVKVGDVIEAYEVTEVQPTLTS